MRPFIVVGDRTSHGGTVITGSPFTDVDGKDVARIGDKATCPRCKRVVTIMTGDLTDIIDGQPVARHGDTTDCGASLISGQMLVYTDDSSGSASSGTKNWVEHEEGNRFAYDQHFQVLNEETQLPDPYRKYRITYSNGVLEGTTDANGLTDIVKSDKPETIKIELF